ncbi:hypothetical protein [Amycolatopsis sp.]|uniref:hypothetical protein n=1 Tax=Amycolatopsis sp. TaxID=37632 RepID=UPI002C204560|nr:hypothetical protein [Amycolatopsis sp.]HVV07724.1 hypothetical protein [Amycolatopsis sp.]
MEEIADQRLETPAPPRRDADGRREPPLDADLCRFCQRHPRKGLGGRGRTADTCDHVWAVDEKGREVTCARLDEADQVIHATYGAAFPGLDLAGFGRDVSAALAVITPLQQGLAALDNRLDEEVTAAKEAAAEAEAARDAALTRAAQADAHAAEAEERAVSAERAAREAEAKAADAAQQAARDRAAAQQATADRIAAQGKAEALEAQVDRLSAEQRQAAERIEDLTRDVAARGTEAEAAHARARSLEQDLRDATERHRAELGELHGRYEQALADLRAQDQAARRQLQDDYDQHTRVLREEHQVALDAERARTSEQAAARARAEIAVDEARAGTASVFQAAERTASRLTVLREGVLTALADEPQQLPGTLRELLAATG